MIALSLLKFLEDNGFGEIDVDLCWGKQGIDQLGIYATELGASQARETRRNTMIQLFSRDKNDVAAYKRLESVRDFLAASYGVCTLPEVVSPCGETLSEGFDKVTIMPPSTISNDGMDSQGRLMFSLTVTIYY